MTSLVIFIFVSYAIAFLAADATIFGCGTAAYNEDPDDADYIFSKGVVRLRPYLLMVRFFRELFSCYFCLGIWTGPVAHVLLYHILGERYWLYHSHDHYSWALGFFTASLASASGCYLFNALIDRLQGVSPEPPDLDSLESYSGHPQND